MKNPTTGLLLALALFSGSFVHAQVVGPDPEEIKFFYKSQCQTEAFFAEAEKEGVNLGEESKADAIKMSYEFNQLLRNPEAELQKLLNGPGDSGTFGPAIACSMIVAMKDLLKAEGCQDPSGQKSDPSKAIAICDKVAERLGR